MSPVALEIAFGDAIPIEWPNKSKQRRMVSDSLTLAGKVCKWSQYVCKEGVFVLVFGGKSVSGNKGSGTTRGRSVIGFSPLLKNGWGASPFQAQAKTLPKAGSVPDWPRLERRDKAQRWSIRRKNGASH